MKPGRTILLGVLLTLGACRDDKSSIRSRPDFAARVEREVKSRVAAMKKDFDLGKTRMHTIRITGYVLLAGGSGVLLFCLQRQRGFHPAPPPQRLPPVTQWHDHYPVPSARVIDTQAPKHPPGQNRNRNPSPSTPMRRNSKRRKNRRHAPTTRA